MSCRIIILVGLLWPGTGVARPALVLPVASACISSPFGPRILPKHPEAGIYHYGVDLPAPDGADVRAVAAGRVILVHQSPLGGLELLVQHPRATSASIPIWAPSRPV